MPKPNRYMGNGKVYPNGTTMGRYVMRNGHWVDIDSPLGRHTPKVAPERSLGLAIWAGAIALATVVTALVLAAS